MRELRKSRNYGQTFFPIYRLVLQLFIKDYKIGCLCNTHVKDEKGYIHWFNFCKLNTE
jgi:hypothetical protein